MFLLEKFLTFRKIALSLSDGTGSANLPMKLYDHHYESYASF